MNSPQNLIQMANELRSNPMSVLSKFGISEDIAHDPQKVIQKLMNNGKVTQEQYDNAVRRAKMFGFKF